MNDLNNFLRLNNSFFLLIKYFLMQMIIFIN